LMLLSALLDARSRPSGAASSERTHELWPERVAMDPEALPKPAEVDEVRTSWIWMEWSSEPE
jgi:hypothetical protein